MGSEKIGVIGLGYVGYPLAAEFSKKYPVVGYDTNPLKVKQYQEHSVKIPIGAGEDNPNPLFTTEYHDLHDCTVYIIALPTPVNKDNTPDLRYLIDASKQVGELLKPGDLVLYESTVYPGTTEEVCIPLLEEGSGLVLNEQFEVGYSPERINPSDPVHTLVTIQKIVSGSNPEALDRVDQLYQSIVEAGTYRASSIRVAEAAKVIENSQRDINIAFINELSMIFHKMDLNTKEILEAASTKWNFIHFQPGLVGGHCIGVDPYYLIYKANLMGYQSQIMTAGRRVNDGMSSFIVQEVMKSVMKQHPSERIRIGVMGVTFKENCEDIRNSKVFDIIRELEEYGVEVLAYDPLADPADVERSYDVQLSNKEDFEDFHTIIIALAHDDFREEFDVTELQSRMKKGYNHVFDLKGLYANEWESIGVHSWML